MYDNFKKVKLHLLYYDPNNKEKLDPDDKVIHNLYNDLESTDYKKLENIIIDNMKKLLYQCELKAVTKLKL